MAELSGGDPVAEQVRATRIVKGVSIPHPCGDPSLPADLDARQDDRVRADIGAILDRDVAEDVEPVLRQNEREFGPQAEARGVQAALNDLRFLSGFQRTTSEAAIESMRAGATLLTSERLVGER